MADAEIGLIGLGVMGSNLALNIAEKGNRIAVFNRTASKTHTFHQEAGSLRDMIVPCETIEDLAAAIRPPRPVIIMVPPPGYNIDQLNAIGEKIETKMRKYWDHDGQMSIRVNRKVPVLGPDGKPIVENGVVQTVEREVDAPTIADFFYVVRGRQLFLGLRGQDPLRCMSGHVLYQAGRGGRM